MKNVREILQSYCIIIIGLIDVTLLLRFFLDFYGVEKNQSLIKIIFSVSQIFFRPFDGTFGSVQTTETMKTDYSVIVAIIAYSVIAAILLSAIRIFFKIDFRNKLTSWIGVFFKFFIVLNIMRLVLTLLNAQESTFMNFLQIATAFTVIPFKTLIPSSSDQTVDLSVSIGSSILLLCLVWYTLHRTLKATIEKKPPFESEIVKESKQDGDIEEPETQNQGIIEKKSDVEKVEERPLVYIPLSQQQNESVQPSPQDSQVQQQSIPVQPAVTSQQQSAPPVSQSQPSVPQQPEQTPQAQTPSQQALGSQALQQQTAQVQMNMSPSDAPVQTEQSTDNSFQSQSQEQQGGSGKIKSLLKKMTEKEKEPFSEGLKKGEEDETERSPLS